MWMMVGGGWMHLDEPPRQNKGEQGNERTNDHHLVIAHGCRHGLEQSGTGQSSKLSCGGTDTIEGGSTFGRKYQTRQNESGCIGTDRPTDTGEEES